MRTQLRKYQYKTKAAMAATLMAGGLSAVMLNAAPASAESPYRRAVERCLASQPVKDTTGECVEEIAAPTAPAKAEPSASLPARPTASSPSPDGPGLVGTVTSGADEAPVVAAAPAIAPPELPNPVALRRQIEQGVKQEVSQHADRVGLSVEPASQPTEVEQAVEQTFEEEEPAETPTDAPSPDASAPVQDWMSGALARLRECESSGNYRANTGNGYYGAYQFSARTWHSLGLGGYPHQASASVQDNAAIDLQARDGWGQWPACSRKLGLR